MLRFLYELCWTMVRGELPFQKFKVALDSVVFTDRASGEELGSCLADIVTQMAQDVRFSFDANLLICIWLLRKCVTRGGT
jgi:hypothetical protein